MAGETEEFPMELNLGKNAQTYALRLEAAPSGHGIMRKLVTTLLDVFSWMGILQQYATQMPILEA